MREKIEILNEIEKIKQSKQMTVERLTYGRDKCIELRLDEKLLNYFKQEMDKADSLKQQANEILMLSEIDEEQIDMIKVVILK